MKIFQPSNPSSVFCTIDVIKLSLWWIILIRHYLSLYPLHLFQFSTIRHAAWSQFIKQQTNFITIWVYVNVLLFPQ